MNIHASIIDQRLVSISENIKQQAEEELNIKDSSRLKSLAFVYLCVKTMLDLEDATVFDCLTEGGGDFGVDAIHISEEYDGEFTVSLFQAKYKNDLEGTANFPETAITILINTITYLFNPSAKLQDGINPRLRAKVEEVRSLIRDGYIPQVRVLACNNGEKWNKTAQDSIDYAKESGFGDQVTWEHVNHEGLIKILQATKPVKDTLQLNGKALVEDMNFSRVLVGRISVSEIAAIIERHGERLLERNIRRYLGLQGNRVNESIQTTLKSEEKTNFYFYNNGITLTCDNFSYNALQNGDYQVRVENLQIINGGQTCITIYKTLTEELNLLRDTEAYVLLRLYQLPSDNSDFVKRITYATNNQNPVDLWDLRSNDSLQESLEIDIKQLNFTYHRKRSDTTIKYGDITSRVAAESVLAIWREKPHQAKFFAREHFGKLYDIIFTKNLNGAQIIIAVLLYRIAENRRKKPRDDDPEFIRYASCFIAMQMGKHLLNNLNITIDLLTHKNFTEARILLDKNGELYFNKSMKDIENALRKLYGSTDISLQQLSATFRRGDLIEKLQSVDN